MQVLANLHTATERLNAIHRQSSESTYSAVDLATMASRMPAGRTADAGPGWPVWPLTDDTFSYSLNVTARQYIDNLTLTGTGNNVTLTNGTVNQGSNTTATDTDLGSLNTF